MGNSLTRTSSTVIHKQKELDQRLSLHRKQSRAIETDELANVNWRNTLPFVPNITKGKVIKVHDGDTITVASKLRPDDSKSDIYRFNVRINGIDAPEISSKDADEKDVAQIAQAELSKLVMNQIVTMDVLCYDKYGRLLADVYHDDIRLSSWMLDHHLAVPYDGGTKISPGNWKQYYNAKASSIDNKP